MQYSRLNIQHKWVVIHLRFTKGSIKGNLTLTHSQYLKKISKHIPMLLSVGHTSIATPNFMALITRDQRKHRNSCCIDSFMVLPVISCTHFLIHSRVSLNLFTRFFRILALCQYAIIYTMLLVCILTFFHDKILIH